MSIDKIPLTTYKGVTIFEFIDPIEFNGTVYAYTIELDGKNFTSECMDSAKKRIDEWYGTCIVQ